MEKRRREEDIDFFDICIFFSLLLLLLLLSRRERERQREVFQFVFFGVLHWNDIARACVCVCVYK